MWAGADLPPYVFARLRSISHGVYWHSLKKGAAKRIQIVMNKIGRAPPSSRVPVGEHVMREGKIARLLLNTSPAYHTDRTDAGWLVLRSWLTGKLQRGSSDEKASYNEFSDSIHASAWALMEIL